ncbi:MAG TPA: hypothetical protein DCS85_00485, partial [Verrucomicrobiales bacterium]|nr:hypothetical protein [Verrucomicrobiales bacterium]
IDLTGLHFVNGIDYQFPESTLAPGAHGLLVGREAAFTQRYGAGHPVIGSYQSGGTSKLANQGERLVLTDAFGVPIADFTWSHQAPWPTSADGLGYSLVLMCPGSNNPTLPTSWRTSALPGGNPSDSDAIDLADWKSAANVTDLFSDDDNDGLAALLEFAGGQDPGIPESGGLIDIMLEDSDNPHPVIAFRQHIGADAISFSAEESINLIDWTAGPTYLGRVNNGDGTSSILFRGSQPASAQQTGYLRILASEKPVSP